MRLTPGITSMIGVIAAVVYMNHLIACFWFFLPKISGYPANNWIFNLWVKWTTNFSNVTPPSDFDWKKAYCYDNSLCGGKNNIFLWYTVSFYWGMQTLLTVGFGDINGKTFEERFFCIFWIVFGVSFYSYTIGNVTNVISSMDIKSEILNEQLQTLAGLRVRIKMDRALQHRIKRHLENN